MILNYLKDHNVAYIEVIYSGGGDDGCIDDIECLDINNKKVEIKSLDLFNELDDLFYDMISDSCDYDWINNDGGHGKLTVNLTENGESALEHTQRVSEDHKFDVHIDKYF